MNKDRIIFISRILLIAGIIIVAIAVLVENWDVAMLSSLKAKKAQAEYDREYDYYVEAPTVPVNEKDYLVAPENPGMDAGEEAKALYEKEMNEFNAEKEKLDKEYQEKQKEYQDALKKYNRKKLENRRKLVVSEGDYWKKIQRLNYAIKQKEIDINKMWFPLILRFLGAIVLLIGSLGILMYGEMYERLGILFLIGFAFKTIVGL